MEAFITSLTSAFSGLATDVMSAIGSIAPVALPVMGAIVVIGVGIKVFKKVTGR